jgi:predicted porin
MNKTLKYALSAVLSAAIITPVLAQDNFPDVPDNHWAYEALARLKKDGLLVGYPDGLFRGNRPASRYELAVAIHATYVHLKSITDGLQAEIDELKNRPQVDIQPLKDAIAALQAEVDNMKGWGADIDNLKKLADQFQKELASLGVDVESLKKDLADLAKRVGVLEAHRLPIDIHGDVNFLMFNGMSNSNRPGITVDGRPVGVRMPGGGFGPGFDMVGGDVDSTIYHELALRLSSNNETGPKWHGTIVVGNMLGSDFSSSVFSSGVFKAPGTGFNQSATLSGVPFAAGAETVTVQDLAVDFDTSVIGQGLNAELGRTSYSIDPYLFQRPATNPYFQNDRWDNGKWTFDGGVLGFHWSGVKLDVFGGKQDQNFTTSGIFQQMTAGADGHPYTPGGQRPVGLLSNRILGSGAANPLSAGIPVNEDLGLNLNVPLGQNGKLDLAYIWFESNQGITKTDTLPSPTDAAIANRASVFGGDLKWNFGQIVFDGGYSQSNLMLGNHNVSNKDNSAWHAGLAYDASRWGIQAGYRDIQPQFGAPGDWGRIGIWWNPTDIKGPEVSAHLNLTDSLKLTAGGEWYTGHNETLYDGTGLGTHDHLDHYTAELGYKLNEAWNLSLGAELVNWRMADRTGLPGANPTERWYNVGLGYNLSDQARLSFLYQWSDYDGKGYPGFAPFGAKAAGFGGDRLTGGLLTTQLTVKF